MQQYVRAVRPILFIIALIFPAPVLAQENSCPAIAYFDDLPGAITAEPNQCGQRDAPCARLEDALEYGKSICPSEVRIRHLSLSYEAMTYIPPTQEQALYDWIWSATQIIAMPMGLVLGWLLAKVLRRKQTAEAT